MRKLVSWISSKFEKKKKSASKYAIKKVKDSPQVERNNFQVMCMMGTYIKNILKTIKTQT